MQYDNCSSDIAIILNYCPALMTGHMTGHMEECDISPPVALEVIRCLQSHSAVQPHLANLNALDILSTVGQAAEDQ